MAEGCVIVACYNCKNAGKCEEKGEFDPEEDLIPCYRFETKTEVLTSAVKYARKMAQMLSGDDDD